MWRFWARWSQSTSKWPLVQINWTKNVIRLWINSTAGSRKMLHFGLRYRIFFFVISTHTWQRFVYILLSRIMNERVLRVRFQHYALLSWPFFWCCRKRRHEKCLLTVLIFYACECMSWWHHDAAWPKSETKPKAPSIKLDAYIAAA